MEYRKLAIVTTHPIQYNAPWFRLLAERGKIEIKVFYTWDKTKDGEKYDPGFGKNIDWDIPLLEGYNFTFVKNTSKNPGSKNYSGIKNPTLIHEIESWKPNAVLVFGWNFQSHLQCMRHFKNKIPVLFRGDSTLLNEQKGFKKIARRMLLTWVYRHIDYALYTGTENKKYFLKHGVKENQLAFTPHAIDNKRFYEKENEYSLKAEKWKDELGVDPAKLIILFAGKLEEVKNPKLIIEVAGQLKRLPVHFILVGNGPLEKEVKAESLATNLTFIDFQNQQMMPVVYRLGDVYILPSKSETWGLAVNEAMACSKPIIVSSQCGCAIDLVEEGKNGFVFQSGNAHELAGKITIMHANKGLRKMGDYSLQKIQSWSFENIAGQVENLLENYK